MKTKLRKILDNLCDNLLSHWAEVMTRCGKEYAIRDVINLKGYDLKKELILDEAEKELAAIGRVWMDEFETKIKPSQPSEPLLYPAEVQSPIPNTTITPENTALPLDTN